MQSIGELAKEFRKARGWSYTRMAQEVAMKEKRPDGPDFAGRTDQGREWMC